MLQKVRGIVLKTTDYSDTSVVAQILTDKFGTQAYLINGVKKPKAKVKMNMLQPLHLLDMVVYHRLNDNLQRVSELRPSPVFRTIPYDLLKTTVIIFLNEVLYKSIRQQTPDENLFDFVFNAISWFDESDQAGSNFHLSFLLKLTRFLGFSPNERKFKDEIYFDLQEGKFHSRTPVHSNYISGENAAAFILLYKTPIERSSEIVLTNIDRRFLLDKILVFYRLHTASFGEIKSHKILETLFG